MLKRKKKEARPKLVQQPAKRRRKNATTLPPHIHTLTVNTIPPPPPTLDTETFLGKGSFGTVIKVMRDNNYCARKRLLRSNKEGIEYSTIRECNMLTVFSHPYILSPCGIEISNHGTVDIFLPLAKEDLQKYITEHNYKERCLLMPRVAYCVSSVLSYLHSHNIIHRDVKPSNILLNQQNVAFLTDYGASKDMEYGKENKVDDLYMTSGLITFPYRPPEVHGNDYDERADIYSLGATLIHLMAGKYPKRTMKQNEKEIPPSAQEWIQHMNASCENLLPSWKDLLCRMMSHNPKDRPTAEEILSSEALGCLHIPRPRGQEIHALPPPGIGMFKEHYDLIYRTKMVDWLLRLTETFRASYVVAAITMMLFDDVVTIYPGEPDYVCLLSACFRLANKYAESILIPAKDLVTCFRGQFTSDNIIRTESYAFLLLNFRITRRPLPPQVFEPMSVAGLRSLLCSPTFYQ